MVGSFDSFLIVFHALRLLCAILVNVMTSSHLLFFSSIILSISLFAASKGLFLMVVLVCFI